MSSHSFHAIFINIEIKIWSIIYQRKHLLTRPYLIKIFTANPLEQKGKMLFYLIQINTPRRFSHSFLDKTLELNYDQTTAIWRAQQLLNLTFRCLIFTKTFV